MEQWKPVAGYEGYYEVSNAGVVRRIVNARNNRVRAGHIMVPFLDRYGYLAYGLRGSSGSKKSHAAHRIVAEAFIPNALSLPQINHINEDKHDNRVENLEWCTAHYNKHHNDAPARRMKKIAQFDMHGDFMRYWDGAIQAGQELSIFRQSIAQCCNGKLRHSGGFKWRMYDEAHVLSDGTMEWYDVEWAKAPRGKCQVIQMTLGGEHVATHKNATQASIAVSGTASNHDHIYACCENKRACKTFGGYTWKYGSSHGQEGGQLTDQ